MKQFLLALVATVSLASIAQAQVNAPLYQCALTFDAAGSGFQIILGHFRLEGEGSLHCVDINGATEDIPVRVALGGDPVALNIAVVPKMVIHGIASGIGISTVPRDLMGKYAVVGASAALLVGGSASVNVKGDQNAIDFDLQLALTEGLGFQAGLTTLEISEL